MDKGHVTYRISGAYLEFAPVTFSLPGSANTKVTMEAPVVANQDESSIHLRVEIEGMATKEEALAEASAVVTAVADRLAYHRGSYFPTPTIQDTAFVEDGVESLGSSFTMFCTGVAVTALGADSVGKLVATVSQATFPGEPYLATLRAALGCDDPIGKFLCLYGILMILAEDDQGEIDTLIERHGVEEPRTPRPEDPKKPRKSNKPPIMETPYTRLRNEVAHRLKTRTVGAIRSEMEQRISGLTDIVRKAIAAVT